MPEGECGSSYDPLECKASQEITRWCHLNAWPTSSTGSLSFLRAFFSLKSKRIESGCWLFSLVMETLRLKLHSSGSWTDKKRFPAFALEHKDLGVKEKYLRKK